MTLAEIRTVLLQQHAALRTRIGEARRATQLWSQDKWPQDDLQQCLERLADELRAHNACEEGLLGDVLPTIDAWGRARLEVMNEAHLDEHRNLCAGLIGATITADPESGSAAILLLLDAMLDHMTREEKIFLDSDVLTDDMRMGEAFGG